MNTFVPTEGEPLVVTLPGEALRAMCVRVLDSNNVVCQLTAIPLMPRGHDYRLDDYVAVKRASNSLQEIWEATGKVVEKEKKKEPEPVPETPRRQRRGS